MNQSPRVIFTALAKLGLAVVTTTIIAAAAAGVGTAGAAPKSPAVPSAASKKSINPLPVMNVTDVKTGKDVALAASLDGKKPLLVWFWAPN